MKDNAAARQEMKLWTYRRVLFLQGDEDRSPLKPKATYTITNEDKKVLFVSVHALKFPDGYVFNISKCFNR